VSIHAAYEVRDTAAVVDGDLEQIETAVGPLLGSFLRPGMTAVAVGDGGLASLMADQVGPGGRVVAVELADQTDPDAVGALLPEGVDLILADSRAIESGFLLGAGPLLERARPVLLALFWPQRLREAGVDPVLAIDRHRAMGLRIGAAEGELPADPGELVLAIDAGEAPFAILRLEPGPPPPPRERLLSQGRQLGREWARRFPPVVEPRTLAYDSTHRALVSSLIESEDWLRLFAGGERLPPGLGAGFDERVVEYPWLFSRGLSGKVLDAGSVLNHRHVVESLLPAVEDLTIVTLAPEPVAFTGLGVSYLYADLRRLPFRDGWFDEVVCLSTLEHVGMDNAIYGVRAPRAEEPQAEAAAALRELLRVVRPGGRVHLSVPYGRREDHGWLRQFDHEDVVKLLVGSGAGRHEEAVFRYTSRGWLRSTSRRAARARYNPTDEKARDGAVAARAVSCVTLERAA
jgi:SAM-dependent methyltransferase